MNDEGRPGEERPLNVVTTDHQRIAELGAADRALRCAALRVTADLRDDPGDWLACSLRDFADLIEVGERRGWFGRG